jgi:membrane fusion protein
MAEPPLFREEALAARSTRSLGTIRLAQPIADRVAAAISLAIIAAIAAFVIFGTYTRRVGVAGLLEPVGGTLRLTTPSSGVVGAVHVVEGRRVEPGDVLFVLSGERVSESGRTGASIAAQLEARRAALDRDARLVEQRHVLRTKTAVERVAAIDVEIALLEHEIAINAARRGIAGRNVERFDELARTGFIAPAQAQARVDDLLVLQAAAENYARVKAALSRERTGLSAQSIESRLQRDAETSDIDRLRAAVEQERLENDARRSTVIVAPHAGSVTGIAVRGGQQVAAGALLATLIPEGGSLDAHLFATTRQVGFVERGQRVRLRYTAFPYQKFGVGDGIVQSVETSPYAPQELPSQVAATLGATASQGVEPVYRIVVALDRQTVRADGREHALRPGMIFEADVVQDRRRLIEWLLEPVFGLAGR